MEALGAVHGLLTADGATFPLVLVGVALGIVGMALYAVIIVVKGRGA